MTRKLTCLADCDHAIYGDDAAALGRRMRDHLRAVHGVPADPSELAGLAIPVAGIRPGEISPTSSPDADATPDA